MRLIADSGSTKTDWCLMDGSMAVKRIKTKGINPFFETEEEIQYELSNALLPKLPFASTIDSIHFFGAGCTPEKIPIMRRALMMQVSMDAHVEVCSDMVGAARALAGHEPGIVCILGTGSNSCEYDGKEIVKNVSPLGFILGDEGSGAVLGKILVGDLLKNQLGEELKQKFLDKYKLTTAEIIERVYRKPFPNSFLASLQPFLEENLDNEAIFYLVMEAFSHFIARNVMQYDYQHLPVHFTGSVAFAYRKVLEKSAELTGIRLGKITKSPLDGLIKYYGEK